MGWYRQIHSKMWRDGWFVDLTTEEKLLFIYLFSNEAASVSGIYELPMRIIAFDTGLDTETIKAALAHFERDGKVFFERGYVWVVNLRKYNAFINDRDGKISNTVSRRIELDLSSIPDCDLKRRYIAYYTTPTIPPPYPIDGVSKSPSEQEQEQEQEQESIAANAAEPPPLKPKQEPTQSQAAFAALQDACNVLRVTDTFRGWANKTVQWLISSGYNEQDINRYAGWWKSDAWRAEHTPMNMHKFESSFGAWVKSGKPDRVNGKDGGHEQHKGKTTDGSATRELERILAERKRAGPSGAA